MNIALHYAIEALVNTLLPRFSPAERMLHLNVAATYEPQGGKGTKKHRDIHLLFQRPGNYTKVFWYVSKQWVQGVDKIPADAWELKCDHDSCWTSDGLSTPLFKLHMELRGNRSNDDVNQFVRFSFTPAQWVNGRLERIEGSEPPQYKVVIASVQKIDEWMATQSSR